MAMRDTLDQSDIDALMSAVSSGEVAPPTHQGQIFSRHRSDLENVEIKEYDFKRPERISKDQMRALHTLHEGFARNFGSFLSGFLFGISSIDAATYVAVLAILAVAALMASYVPARRATRVDPLTALRSD